MPNITCNKLKGSSLINQGVRPEVSNKKNKTKTLPAVWANVSEDKVNAYIRDHACSILELTIILCPDYDCTSITIVPQLLLYYYYFYTNLAAVYLRNTGHLWVHNWIPATVRISKTMVIPRVCLAAQDETRKISRTWEKPVFVLHGSEHISMTPRHKISATHVRSERTKIAPHARIDAVHCKAAREFLAYPLW